MPYKHLLSDKNIVAALPRICMQRSKLTQLFRRAEGKRVVFLSAPAGYGKTVSAQLYLAQSGRKHVWIGLDRYDNTPSIFYKLVSSGILSLQPDNSTMEDVYCSPTFTSSPVEHTIRLIAELKSDDNQYAVILDDTHTITNENLLKSGLLVQKRLPLSFLLLVLTRNKISDDILSTIGEGKYAVISEEELAFSADEIQEFFHAHGRTITDHEAAEVHSITGGWAIGVKAMALSGKIEPDQTSGRIWDDYFKREIWDNWEEDLRAFMLKTSIVDSMPVELCQKLTGREDSQKVLETLWSDNTFVTRLSEDEYNYHHLFLDFLRSQLLESGIKPSTLHRRAARYYLERGEYFIAKSNAVKSADLKVLIQVMHKLSCYGSAALDDFVYFSKLYDPIPCDLCDKAPFLYGSLMWENYLIGNASRMEHYMDKLLQHLPSIESQFPESIQTVIMQISLDHRVSLSGLSKRFSAFHSNINAVPGIHSTTLTHEMPYLHRSNRDYYELTDKQLFDNLRASFGPLLMEYNDLFFAMVESGLSLEQNRRKEALESALYAEKLLTENTSAELRFSVYIHILAAHYDMRNPKYLKIMAEAEGFIERSGTNNLRPNFLAVKAKIQLLDGNKNAAAEWLDNYFVTDFEQPELYKIFQYFTTVRAYIVLGKTDQAMWYIGRLQQLAFDFKRPLDLAEARVLRAIVEWSMGMKSDARLTLESVLISLQPYGFIRVVAVEGAAVLPILKRLADKLKKGNYQGALQPEYLHEVMLAAYEQSKRQRGITARLEDQPTGLSKQQKLVLTLLSRGYKYMQIAEETGITIHTVKSHASAAYGKLRVSNSMDAVIKARGMGFID